MSADVWIVTYERDAEWAFCGAFASQDGAQGYVTHAVELNRLDGAWTEIQPGREFEFVSPSQTYIVLRCEVQP